MSIKLAQKMILLEKMIDFDTFTKIPLEFERFGQIKCCQKHLKVGQSPINHQIWSHWFRRRGSGGGGLVVIVLAFRSHNPSSNPFEVDSHNLYNSLIKEENK